MVRLYELALLWLELSEILQICTFEFLALGRNLKWRRQVDSGGILDK